MYIRVPVVGFVCEFYLYHKFGFHFARVVHFSKVYTSYFFLSLFELGLSVSFFDSMVSRRAFIRYPIGEPFVSLFSYVLIFTFPIMFAFFL